MDVLRAPFQFNGSGSAAHVVQGSDEHKAQKLAALTQTNAGALPLAPNYGVADMLFGQINLGEIAAAIGVYHPDVAVADVLLFQTSTGRDAIQIVFTNETTGA